MDQPLGIADLLKLFTDYSPPYPEHWYWCRRHQRAEPSTDPGNSDQFPGVACIRIGPFMSEAEAHRLSGGGCMHCDPEPEPPLGMEVE